MAHRHKIGNSSDDVFTTMNLSDLYVTKHKALKLHVSSEQIEELLLEGCFCHPHLTVGQKRSIML